MLDDLGKHNLGAAAKRMQLEKIRSKQWILQRSSLTGKAKLLLWKSLFLSKWTYGMEVFIAQVDSVYECYKSLYYKSVKMLTGITGTISKDVLLNTAVDQNFRCYTSNRMHTRLTNLNIVQDPLCRHCKNHSWTPLLHVPSFETLTQLNANDIFRLRVNALFTGWKMQTSDRSASKWQPHLCQCQDRLTIDHISRCEHQTYHRNKISDAIQQDP